RCGTCALDIDFFPSHDEQASNDPEMFGVFPRCRHDFVVLVTATCFTSVHDRTVERGGGTHGAVNQVRDDVVGGVTLVVRQNGHGVVNVVRRLHQSCRCADAVKTQRTVVEGIEGGGHVEI